MHFSNHGLSFSVVLLFFALVQFSWRSCYFSSKTIVPTTFSSLDFVISSVGHCSGSIKRSSTALKMWRQPSLMLWRKGWNDTQLLLGHCCRVAVQASLQMNLASAYRMRRLHVVSAAFFCFLQIIPCCVVRNIVRRSLSYSSSRHNWRLGISCKWSAAGIKCVLI